MFGGQLSMTQKKNSKPNQNQPITIKVILALVSFKDFFS